MTQQLYQHNTHIMCIYRFRNTDPCEPQVLYIGFGYSIFQPGTDNICYNTYGVTCTEVEMDVLTGQYLINRVDLLYDCGERYGLISNNIENLSCFLSMILLVNRIVCHASNELLILLS